VLGIPFVNRPDLLRAAVNSVQTLWPNALIVDNSEAGLLDDEWPLQILRPTVPLSFTQTMNCLLQVARSRACDALLFIHNDAEAEGDTAQRLASLVTEAVESGRHWGVFFTHYDAFAAINTAMSGDVGDWDTVFPQYFADNDFYRRVRLANYDVIDTGLPVRHNNASNTIRSDPRRLFVNNVTFPLYERYYSIKWGGPPGYEVYSRPFNGGI
jgi:hypothetical protein